MYQNYYSHDYPEGKQYNYNHDKKGEDYFDKKHIL